MLSSAIPKDDTGRIVSSVEVLSDLSVPIAPSSAFVRAPLSSSCALGGWDTPQRQVDQDSPSGAFAKSYAIRKNQELSISPSEREV